MVIKTNDIEGPMGDRWTISTENNVISTPDTC